MSDLCLEYQSIPLRLSPVPAAGNIQQNVLMTPLLGELSEFTGLKLERLKPTFEICVTQYKC